MNQIVSVDKSLIAGGNVQWFVTMEDDNGGRTRVEIDEAAAHRFEQVIRSQGDQAGPRLLTETLP